MQGEHGSDDKTLRDACAKVDISLLAKAGFARLAHLAAGAAKAPTTLDWISAVRHHDAVTVAARQIPAKSNEIPAFAPLLDDTDDTDLAEAVVTIDALHAQRDHGEYLVAKRGAHYQVTVKGNQPSLSAQLRTLPWRQVPVVHRSLDVGHGREEYRELQVVTVHDLLFPHARQAGISRHLLVDRRIHRYRHDVRHHYRADPRPHL